MSSPSSSTHYSSSPSSRPPPLPSHRPPSLPSRSRSPSPNPSISTYTSASTSVSLPASKPSSPAFSSIAKTDLRHASSATTLHLPVGMLGGESEDADLKEDGGRDWEKGYQCVEVEKETDMDKDKRTDADIVGDMGSGAGPVDSNADDVDGDGDVTLNGDADEEAWANVSAATRVSTTALLKWEDLPEWRQDNAFVLAGYRPETKSIWRSMRSVFGVHNESVNIYSHLLGAILFTLLPIYIYHTLTPRVGVATMADVIVFTIFFSGVFCCFSLSFLFHSLCNHSEKLAKVWVELDYTGIVVLMWGSMVPTIYHGFVCSRKLQMVYWSMITLFAILCILITLIPSFRTPVFRVYRTLMYAGLGFSSLVFIIHSIILYGFELQNKRLSLGWIVGMAGLNFCGALAYSLRFPERLAPGKFDIYGNSHQILHILTVFATLAHFAGLVSSFDYLHVGVVNESCPVGE